MERDRLQLVTPEGLTLDLPLAGAGSRGVATTIDLTIQALILYLIERAITVSSWQATVAVIVLDVLVLVAYYPLFETRASGRTLGKMVMRLRVVRADGGPVRLGGSLIRTFLRLIDFLPLGYVVGMATVLSTRHSQRLGDLAAGTVVVQEGPRKAPAALPSASYPSWTKPLPTEGWDVSQVSARELALIRQFLERRETLASDARQRLGVELYTGLRSKILVPADARGVERILEGVVAAKQAAGSKPWDGGVRSDPTDGTGSPATGGRNIAF